MNSPGFLIFLNFCLIELRIGGEQGGVKIKLGWNGGFRAHSSDDSHPARPHLWEGGPLFRTFLTDAAGSA